MKKIISSLIITAVISSVANAQTSNNTNLKNSFNLAQQNLIDDFEEDNNVVSNSIKNTKVIDTKNALRPTSTEVKNLSKRQEIPDNIKQDYKENDDGYLLEGFQLGVGVGILGGANAQLGYRIPQRNYNFWKNRFGFRIDYNSWKPLKNEIEKYIEENPIEIDDEKFTGMITGTNYGALIDFYPFGNTWFLGNFRISGGYYTGDFAMNAYMTKTGGGEFEMKNIKYKFDATATLNAGIEADVKGPYAGIGFDFALLFGLKLYFDAGVVFIDNPKVTTDITGTGNLQYKTPFQSDWSTPISINAKENETVKQLLDDTKAEYEDELDIITNSKIFPMVKLGLMLRF